MSRSPLRLSLSHSLLFGSVLLLFSGTFTGCGDGTKAPGPISAAKSQYQVADDDQGGAPAAKARVGDQPEATKSPPATGPGAAAAKPAGEPRGAVRPSDADTAGGRSSDKGPSGTPPGDGKPASAVEQPPLMPPIGAKAKPVDLKVTPDDREGLLAYLAQLQTQPPQGQNQQEMVENYRQIHQARINAADKLTALAKDLPDRIAAAQAKLDAMAQLAQANFPNADKQLHTYCRELLKSPEKELALLGRLVLFDRDTMALRTGEVRDAQPVLAELKALAAEGADNPGVFRILSNAAINLQIAGFKEPAMDAFRTLAKAYQGSKDPNLAEQAKSLLERVRVIEIDFEGKLRAMMEGKPDSAGPVMQAITELLKGERLGPGMLEAMLQAAQVLEMTDHYEQASQAYAAIGEAFKNHEDKQVAEHAARGAANGRRRLALLGEPFAVEGVLIDGAKFDWAAYKGKYVLVDFWATWCGPCMQEIPHVEKYYKLYRDKGFEVVGVNLDNEVDRLKQMLSLQPLPWPTVVSPSAEARGFDTPLAVKCGVDAIPFMVLLDREGKVLALHVRGERLVQQLAKLLGPVPESAAGPGAKPAPPPTGPENPAPAPKL